jgi:hypothetical protein
MRPHLLALAAVCLASAVASAQGPSNEEAPMPPDFEPEGQGDGPKVPRAHANLPVSPIFFTGIGVSVEAGGGFGDFLDQRARSATTAEGLWTVRVSVGTRRHLAFDAAYVGNAQTVHAPALEHDAKLSGHGAETCVRYNMFTGAWQPYVSAGVGFVHYTFGRAVAAEGVASSGNVIELPLAVGVALRWSALVLDTCFALHTATGWDMVIGANMSTWNIAARLGVEF